MIIKLGGYAECNGLMQRKVELQDCENHKIFNARKLNNFLENQRFA